MQTSNSAEDFRAASKLKVLQLMAWGEDDAHSLPLVPPNMTMTGTGPYGYDAPPPPPSTTTTAPADDAASPPTAAILTCNQLFTTTANNNNQQPKLDDADAWAAQTLPPTKKDDTQLVERVLTHKLEMEQKALEALLGYEIQPIHFHQPMDIYRLLPAGHMDKKVFAQTLHRLQRAVRKAMDHLQALEAQNEHELRPQQNKNDCIACTQEEKVDEDNDEEDELLRAQAHVSQTKTDYMGFLLQYKPIDARAFAQTKLQPQLQAMLDTLLALRTLQLAAC